MPAPRRLPDDVTLARLHAAGVPAAQVGRAYGTGHAAVLAHWQRLGLDPRAPHYGILPWTLAVEHRRTGPADYVRTLAGEATGRRAPTRKRETARRWARNLAAQQLTLTYAPDQGFRTRPTRPTDVRRTLTMPDGERLTLTLEPPTPDHAREAARTPTTGPPGHGETRTHERPHDDLTPA